MVVETDVFVEKKVFSHKKVSFSRDSGIRTCQTETNGITCSINFPHNALFLHMGIFSAQ